MISELRTVMVGHVGTVVGIARRCSLFAATPRERSSSYTLLHKIINLIMINNKAFNESRKTDDLD
jgi:hypothetical protein